MKFDREQFGYYIENPSAWENGFEQVISDHMNAALHEMDRLSAPIPMRLTCPVCSALHIDEGEFATKAHHTHSCQSCGMTWRPAVVATVGVQFLPGFKN
jgi:rubredoxin